MRFPWREEQQLLQSTLQRFVADRSESGARRSGGDDWRDTWRELAELGVLGLPFAEEDGGSGGSALDVALVMEALGAGLLATPYVPAVVLAGAVLRQGASTAQRKAHIPPLIAGETLLGFGFAEPQSRHNPAHVLSRARRSEGGWVLEGRKSVVFAAPETKACFVTARTGGQPREAGGLSIFLVPLDAPGVSLRAYTCLDGQTAGELTIKGVEVGAEALFGEADGALPIVERALDEAAAAVAAEAVGIMGALNARCLEFSRTRRAFGQSLADFQVIQHRLIDMHLAYEVTSAAALKAAQRLSESDGRKAARAVSAAKAQVNEEAFTLAKAAVQMHGAIGITDELDVGNYFKRIMAIRPSFGDTDHHLRRCILLDRASNDREPAYGH